MALQESDISWVLLRRIVRDWSGTAAELVEVKPLAGGCINTTLALTMRDGTRAVVKISPHRVNKDYEREAFQLRLLKDHGLPVPEVFGVHVASLDNPDSFLLMEYMDGVDLHEARRRCSAVEYDELQRHLAELVVAMHHKTSPDYHRIHEGELERFESWPHFFKRVYDPIWMELEKSNLLPVRVRKQVSRIHNQLERLVAHDDCPRLVHWDIWATNILAGPDERGRWRISGLLDPNCKYAHAEAEIAYMELFHTITPAFLKAYHTHHPLSPDYHRVRRHIYQLYPLIDHVHLFGASYIKPLMATIERIAEVL